MRRIFAMSCLLAASVLWPVTASAQSAPSGQPTRIESLKVEGSIDRPLLNWLIGELDTAEREGAIIVLQLDVRGTINEDGVALAQRIADLEVPVLTWTGAVPATASGAGMLLMYASSLASVAPGSQTGPLRPIDLTEPDATDPGLEETIQGWLDERDKDTRLVRQQEALTAQEALDLEIAQVAALSVPDLLNQVDGTTVQTPGGPVTLDTRIATDAQEAEEGTVALRFNEPDPLTRLLHGVATPSMVYFLLVLGLACVAFEVTQPGFGFAGFAGIGMLLLAGYGLWVIPPNIVGGLLLVGGVGLMVWDVVLRRLGVLTALGLIAFAAGSFLAWNTTVAEPITISAWLIVGAIVASLLYYGFGLTVAIQSRDRIVNTQRGLIGLTGEARGRIAPEGPVYVKGAVWRGRSTGDPIESGTPIRVRGVEGLVLKVEAEPESAVGASGTSDPEEDAEP
jgi:membrane-bound serine protease (ClpP class)